MQFRCPNCHMLLKANIALSGEKCRCRNCGGELIIPAATSDSGYTNIKEIPDRHAETISAKPRKLLQIKDIIKGDKNIDENFPNIKQAILLLLSYLGITFIIAIPPYIILDSINPDLVHHSLFSMAVSIIAISILVKYVSNRSRITISDMLFKGDFNAGLMFSGFMAILGIDLFLALSITFILGLLPTLNEPLHVFQSNSIDQFKLNSWGTIANLIIVGPIVEEILNRGIILRGFLKNYSVKKAVIISALLFGIMHFNPIQIIAATIAGFFLGFIYAKTKSLKSCIALHGMNNLLPAIAIAVLSFTQTLGIESTSSEGLHFSFYIPTILIAASIGVAGVLLFIRNYKQTA
jgi:membrane protease YdiL (CAAX protease family)